MTRPDDAVPDDELNDALPALPDADVERVVTLLEEAGALHPDLKKILSDPDPDRVFDDIFRDEVHARHT